MDMEKEKIRRKIKSIKSLPTLPAVALKVSKMAENDNTSAVGLGKIISTDQALSGRVLRLVNSSFYGFPGRISSISNAIVLLGFEVVKSLVISVSVFEMMEKGIIGLWEHSLGCAIASTGRRRFFSRSSRRFSPGRRRMWSSPPAGIRASSSACSRGPPAHGSARSSASGRAWSA